MQPLIDVQSKEIILPWPDTNFSLKQILVGAIAFSVFVFVCALYENISLGKSLAAALMTGIAIIALCYLFKKFSHSSMLSSTFYLNELGIKGSTIGKQ